jgi:hypothetical protein
LHPSGFRSTFTDSRSEPCTVSTDRRLAMDHEAKFLRLVTLTLWGLLLIFPSFAAFGNPPYGVFLWQQVQATAAGITVPPYTASFGSQNYQPVASMTNAFQNSLNGSVPPNISDSAIVSISGTSQQGSLSSAGSTFSIAVNGGDAEATAISNAGWTDTVTITSQTLPAGSPVQVQVTETLSAKLQLAPAVVSLTAYSLFQAYTQAGEMVLPISLVGTSQFPNTSSGVINAVVGESFIIDAQLSTMIQTAASGDATQGGSISGLSGAPSAVASVTIDPITACVSYTTASGSNYSSSTPGCGTPHIHFVNEMGQDIDLTAAGRVPTTVAAGQQIPLTARPIGSGVSQPWQVGNSAGQTNMGVAGGIPPYGSILLRRLTQI